MFDVSSNLEMTNFFLTRDPFMVMSVVLREVEVWVQKIYFEFSPACLPATTYSRPNFYGVPITIANRSQ